MGKVISAFVFLAMLSASAQASSILVSSFGWTGVDDTQAFISAFTSSVDTVIVDLQSGDWVTGPLIFDGYANPKIANRVIIFERGVRVRALAGAWDGVLYHGLLNFVDCNNVELNGYGATLQMNKQEYIDLNDGSEWRHVIQLSGCSNFDIYGLELIDSGGDGIEISGIWSQPIPSMGIHVKDCRIDNNYRQGISVTSAQNVLIENCLITNTSGTPPGFGIDLEPDNDYDDMSNIEIRHCRITGNEGGGILLAFWKLNQNSSSVSVDIADCYIGSNGKEGIVIDVNSSGPVPGYANFTRCVVENQPGNGIFSNKRESLALTFTDMVIRNVGTDGGAFDMPVFIQKQFDYTGLPLGNITFDKVFIDDHLFARNFMNINHWGEFTHVENVSGDFSVYNPNGVTYHIDPPLVNVSITTQALSSLPLADISITTSDNMAFEVGEDTTAAFELTRSNAPDISFPLGVYFSVAGTAENRLDYHYFPKAVVIPADASSTSYTVFAIKDELAEPQETIDIVLQPDGHYSALNSGVLLYIGDMLLPVDYIEPFTAVAHSDCVELKWATAIEVNSSHYVIQRSVNAQEWEELMRVDGRGATSTTTHYRVLDESPLPGVSYYRLKQVDWNGDCEYSGIVSVKWGSNGGTVSVYPNPVKTHFTLQSEFYRIVDVELYDVLGQLIERFCELENGTIDVSFLSPGVYFLQLNSLSEKVVVKFVKE